MPEVLPEGESIHRICEHVPDDENPREATGEPLGIDLAEKSERSAPFAVIGGQLHVAISCGHGDETRGCEAEPCPCTSDPDNHTECRENTAADHAANGHRPCRVEAKLRFRLIHVNNRPSACDC